MKMKKRAYRAQNIKKLDTTKVLEAVRGRRVVVATDVAKTDMVSSVELWDGSLVAMVRWSNPSELRRFVSLVIELRPRNKITTPCTISLASRSRT